MIRIYCENKIRTLMKYLKNSKEVIVSAPVIEDSIIKCVKEEYYLPKYGLSIHVEKRAIKSDDYKFKFIDIENLNILEGNKSELEKKIFNFEKEVFSTPKKEKSFFKKYFDFLNDDSSEGDLDKEVI